MAQEDTVTEGMPEGDVPLHMLMTKATDRGKVEMQLCLERLKLDGAVERITFLEKQNAKLQARVTEYEGAAIDAEKAQEKAGKSGVDASPAKD